MIKHTNKSSFDNTNDNMGIFARVLQYQPTYKLVKWLTIWWGLVVILTAIKLSDGFGISALKTFAKQHEMLFSASLGLLAIIGCITVLDVLVLVATSQYDSYHVERKYPYNVAIFHTTRVEMFLYFLPQQLSGLLAKILQIAPIKQIDIQIADEYPNQFKYAAQNVLNEHMLITTELSFDHLETIDLLAQSKQPAIAKKITYELTPVQRGTARFGITHLKVFSPLGLFSRKLLLQTDNSKHIRVLSDFTGLLSNQLAAVFERSFDAGIQTLMQQGQGSEFLKLREYSVGDSIRQIDWKASSRQRKLMSKSYEDENDQDIIFLLDCGEQMRHKQSHNVYDSLNQHDDDLTLSYFDNVLNAILFLSYIANKQGDRVGLMTFAGIDKFIAPTKGNALIKHLLNETADLQPTLYTSDYQQAAHKLKQSLKKRSLVIVITNTRQEASDELVSAMQLLAKSHQLVFANLIEQSIDNILNLHTVPTSFDDALLYHSLTDYQLTRDVLHHRLAQDTSALCLQTTANKLPIDLTQAYLSIRK